MSELTGRHDPAGQRVFSGGTPTVLLPTARIVQPADPRHVHPGFRPRGQCAARRGSAAAGIPLGRLLDVTAPGLLLARSTSARRTGPGLKRRLPRSSRLGGGCRAVAVAMVPVTRRHSWTYSC
jgi:hypothetical protein